MHLPGGLHWKSVSEPSGLVQPGTLSEWGSLCPDWGLLHLSTWMEWPPVRHTKPALHGGRSPDGGEVGAAVSGRWTVHRQGPLPLLCVSRGPYG